jgi:hypothetical protein
VGRDDLRGNRDKLKSFDASEKLIESTNEATNVDPENAAELGDLIEVANGSDVSAFDSRSEAEAKGREPNEQETRNLRELGKDCVA